MSTKNPDILFYLWNKRKALQNFPEKVVLFINLSRKKNKSIEKYVSKTYKHTPAWNIVFYYLKWIIILFYIYIYANLIYDKTIQMFTEDVKNTHRKRYETPTENVKKHHQKT